MTRKTSRFAAVLASAAAFSMMASPAMAQGWGWGGWGGGWGGRHHHSDIDAGDVITGILIIGGIAAIASAASNSGKNKRYERRDDPYRNDPYDRDYSRDNNRDDRPQWQGGGNSINDAVNRCLGEVSRGSSRVDQVDQVSREGDGWRVVGRTANGGQFSCAVDGDGRIRNVNVDGHAN